jgi:hypothetical protein
MEVNMENINTRMSDQLSNAVYRLSAIGALKFVNLDFLHAEHGFHSPLRLLRVRVIHHLDQNGRNNLLGDTIFILEPAALLRFFVTACGQLFPVIVHFLLRLATYLKRDSFIEFEHWATIRAVKLCPSSSKAAVITVPASFPCISCSASP